MSARRKLIAGNWKMHKDLVGCRSLAGAVASGLGAELEADILLCPPAPFLSTVVEAVSGSGHPIAVGSQNLHNEPQGAYTGEISCEMILSTGATWTLIGHSERRHVFDENDDFVQKKVVAALEAKLHPILCVGETLDEREAGKTGDVVLGQVRAGLRGLESAEITKTVIAYEPVWAIGTGKTATSAQAQEVHAFIRNLLGDIFDEDTAVRVRIQYGGSVKPDNARELMSQADVDGALVGGASLDVRKFSEIILNSI